MKLNPPHRKMCGILHFSDLSSLVLCWFGDGRNLFGHSSGYARGWACMCAKIPCLSNPQIVFFCNDGGCDSDLERKSSEGFMDIWTLYLTLSLRLFGIRDVGMHGHSDLYRHFRVFAYKFVMTV